jgi:hypothetical protein
MLGCGRPLSLGSARLGSARLGSARLGSARLGSARLGSARLGSQMSIEIDNGYLDCLTRKHAAMRPVAII